MKLSSTFITVIILSLAAHAQTVSPTILAASDGFFYTAGGSISYTVGEMTMVQTFSGAGHILTQGFQQPSDIPTDLPAIKSCETGDLILYPNPAIDRLCYTFQFSSTGRLSLVLTNVSGQRITEFNDMGYEGGKISKIAYVSMLAAGTYFMTAAFTDRNTNTTSFISRKFEIIR